MRLPLARRLGRVASPIKIRYTLRQARRCGNTSAVLHQLLWIFPWYFAVPEPLSYSELQSSPEIVDSRQHGIRSLYDVPLFHARDTPLRSLYRLYDDLCADQRTLVTYECEYFFRRGSKRWLLSQIPDPKDPDPVRYAILASLVEALVDAFNWKLELGIRRGNMPSDQSPERATNFIRELAPAWTKNVVGLEKHVSLINRETEPFSKSDANFAKRNIEAATGHMYTV